MTENKIYIMFVCMGNICRSPTAHAVMQKIVDEQNLNDQIVIESSGTHAYHVGEQADRRAQATAKSRGIDMSHLRAQKIAITDYDKFDWILAMDEDNLELIDYYAPENHAANCRLLMDFATESVSEEGGEQYKRKVVPDPYYGGDQGFEEVFDMVENACSGLLDHILKTYQLKPEPLSK